jgi:hypothetical protein
MNKLVLVCGLSISRCYLKFHFLTSKWLHSIQENKGYTYSHLDVYKVTIHYNFRRWLINSHSIISTCGLHAGIMLSSVFTVHTQFFICHLERQQQTTKCMKTMLQKCQALAKIIHRHNQLNELTLLIYIITYWKVFESFFVIIFLLGNNVAFDLIKVRENLSIRVSDKHSQMALYAWNSENRILRCAKWNREIH